MVRKERRPFIWPEKCRRLVCFTGVDVNHGHRQDSYFDFVEVFGHAVKPKKNAGNKDNIVVGVNVKSEIVLVGPESYSTTDSQGRWEELIGLFLRFRREPDLRAALKMVPEKKRETCLVGTGIALGLTLPNARMTGVVDDQSIRPTSLNVTRRRFGMDLVDIFNPESPLVQVTSRYSNTQLNSPLAECFDFMKSTGVNKLTPADVGGANDLPLIQARARVALSLMGGQHPRPSDLALLHEDGIAIAY